MASHEHDITIISQHGLFIFHSSRSHDLFIIIVHIMCIFIYIYTQKIHNTDENMTFSVTSKTIINLTHARLSRPYRLTKNSSYDHYRTKWGH